MSDSVQPKDNLQEREDATRLLHFRVLEHRLQQVWAEFTAAGFEPILIKGWAAAQLYPKPFERQFSDADLAFDPSEFAGAQEFVAQRNFPLAIDLHKGLRHLDTVSFGELFASSTLKNCAAGEIRILSEEDHLRVLAVHWLNDGGAPRERLWDIYYAVANRSPNFNWERCLSAISSKRRRWIICAIALAKKYLNLPTENLPFSDELKEVPVWLVKTIEKEWASDVRLRPLAECRHNRKEFWRQLKKRIPPNALQATIEMEGDFDSHPRIYYQTLDVFKRLAPWFRSSWKSFDRGISKDVQGAGSFRKNEKG